MRQTKDNSRGTIWFAELVEQAPLQKTYSNSVLVADAAIAGRPARFIAVAPDPNGNFPRARNGEVGVIEGWQIAQAVHELAAKDRDSVHKTPIVAIIDVPSQAYGKLEEAFGIHQALAAAAGAYAAARLNGHPVIGLIVGKAISGGFLAHGYQANRLIAFNDPDVSVHAMSKESAARITLRAVDELEKLAATVPPIAYDIASYSSLGLLWRSINLESADVPTIKDKEAVQTILKQALTDIQSNPDRSLSNRLAGSNREASARVREKMRKQWADA